VCDIEVIGAPSIFRLIRKASTLRGGQLLPTLTVFFFFFPREMHSFHLPEVFFNPPSLFLFLRRKKKTGAGVDETGAGVWMYGMERVLQNLQ
jgi:hypothetical protein